MVSPVMSPAKPARSLGSTPSVKFRMLAVAMPVMFTPTANAGFASEIVHRREVQSGVANRAHQGIAGIERVGRSQRRVSSGRRSENRADEVGLELGWRIDVNSEHERPRPSLALQRRMIRQQIAVDPYHVLARSNGEQVRSRSSPSITVSPWAFVLDDGLQVGGRRI